MHHKNGVRHDNRLDNPELWASAHMAGQRVEDLLAWCVMRYPEQLRDLLLKSPVSQKEPK